MKFILFKFQQKGPCQIVIFLKAYENILSILKLGELKMHNKVEEKKDSQFLIIITTEPVFIFD